MRHCLATLAIRSELDVVSTRQRSRQLAHLLGFDGLDQSRIGTAASGVARSILRQGGGSAAFAVEDRPPRLLIELDHGGENGSQRAADQGVLQSAERLMDDCDVQQSADGTTVRLWKSITADDPLCAERIASIRDALSRRGDTDPYREIEVQQHELVRSLAELQARNEELARLDRELEDTNRGVVALYAELDEKAARLRRADETKTRFFSSVGHELRTPLHGIRALSRLLLSRVDGPLTEEQTKQVAFVLKAAEDLSQLVDDLLDLAKIQAGKVGVSASHFDVGTLFSALRGMFRPLVVSPEVRLVFDVPDDPPMLFTDEAKTAQILRNFVSNALKFTERGEVRVDAAASDDEVVFAVRDTGIGIAPEHRELIFEEFTQLPSHLQTRQKGTGLGLPLSRRLAELLGGSVGVESEPGRSSTFYLRLPRTLPSAAGQGAARVPDTPDAGGSATPEARRRTALVVDDEASSRYLLRHELEQSFTVHEAASGDEGLARARELLPDVLVLDLELPDASGDEILERLRHDRLTAWIPVVITTARALDARERARLENRAALVVGKDRFSAHSVAAVLAVRPAEEQRR